MDKRRTFKVVNPESEYKRIQSVKNNNKDQFLYE